MSNRRKQVLYKTPLATFVPQALTDLIGNKGVEVVERVGVDAVKDVIAEVLCGRNLRNSTEMLTRRRLGMLNAATLVMFVRGAAEYGDLLKELPAMAAAGLKKTKSRPERRLLEWIIGLTTKGVQNVLRDSEDALDSYVGKLTEASKDIAQRCKDQFGAIAAEIQLPDEKKIQVSWDFFIALFCTIGSQTLFIRGSEKSTYGKLFERLVLGSVLTILGFKLVPSNSIPQNPEMVFWLSSRFGARESDATLILKPGVAVRFDLGFIGRGNPEISKDKLSRFERQLEVDGESYYSTTFVIVDRIGDRSRIVDQASNIGGVIIQMSLSQWPKALASELHQRYGFSHALLTMNDRQADEFIRERVRELDISRFLGAVSAVRRGKQA